jgi:hypothetical protein
MRGHDDKVNISKGKKEDGKISGKMQPEISDKA